MHGEPLSEMMLDGEHAASCFKLSESLFPSASTNWKGHETELPVLMGL